MKVKLSQYLAAKTVKKGAVVEFVDGGREEVSETFKYDDGNPVKSMVCTVLYEGEKKNLKINKASKICLVEAWGDESDNWIGKRARINVLPTGNGALMIVLDPVPEPEWS